MSAFDHAAPPPSENVRALYVRRGRRLEYFTLAWDLLEAIISIPAGVFAGSVALIGFGLDSVIEMSSGAVLLWRLFSDRDPESRERIERRALRLVGITLLALAAYVAVDAAHSLVVHEMPHPSFVGIGIAAAALIVMPVLARSKRRVAGRISSRALVSDSRQTDICAWLSAILLVGLALNAWLGWWWSDPVAALLMTPIIAREGMEALRGHHCSCEAPTE